MKSVLPGSLIACLVASTVPVTAQEQIETPASFDRRGPATQPPASPLAAAIKREAVRLTPEPRLSGVNAVQRGDRTGRSDWSRVRKLAPGTEVTLFLRGSQYRKGHVVVAGESGLVVLNLTDPALPVSATHMLLDLATHHPEYFAETQTTGLFVDNAVRVGPDGVFVADQKVADLGQIVERIARSEVVEIRSESARGHPVAKGALIGAAAGIGTAFAVVASASPSGSCRDCGFYLAYFSLIFGGSGAGIGAGIGAIIGASTHDTEGVIYRAP